MYGEWDYTGPIYRLPNDEIEALVDGTNNDEFVWKKLFSSYILTDYQHKRWTLVVMDCGTVEKNPDPFDKNYLPFTMWSYFLEPHDRDRLIGAIEAQDKRTPLKPLL